MDKVKHIVQFSGGKDSTCMLLMMLEKGMPVDDIIFCDTGMEFPQMYEHIDKVEQYIGRKITRLKAERDYEWYMLEKPISRGKNKGQKGFGWAGMHNRWCTREFKIEPTARYLKDIKGNYLNYIGIAADEPKRHFSKSVPDNVIHPLFDWGITEKMALQTCYNHGFTWGGLYETFRRVSCWCCPLQPIGALRRLYHDFPELWQKLKDMDNRSLNSPKKGYDQGTPFRADYTVQELEERFQREDYLKKISIPLFNDQVS